MKPVTPNTSTTKVTMMTGYASNGAIEPMTALKRVNEFVARTYNLTPSSLHSKTRCRSNVVFARQIAMYLVHVQLSYPLKDVAEYYRRDRTTVSHACGVVEDKRDDEHMELLMSCFESAIEMMKESIPTFDARV